MPTRVLNSRRIWPIVRRIWIATGLSVTGVFVVWSLLAFRATSDARRAAESDSLVAVDHADGVWRFTSNDRPRATTTLLFFPGALVDPRAYAPLAHTVAESGFSVVLVELPRRGALGGADSPELASRIRLALETEGSIVVAGHSRGAVVASRVAAENTASLRGLAIIGSSHPRDYDLSALEIPVTKIVATRDGLASPEEVRQNARLLPGHTRWIWIEGGNHSQFGWYGFQPMDRRPHVAAAAQRATMIEGVLEILSAVEQGHGEGAPLRQ